jgi:integrase
MQRNRTAGVRKAGKKRTGRNRNGEGSVYQSTNDGYWKTELTVDGRTIKRSSRTQEEAEAKLAELVRQQSEGLEMGSDQQTVGQYLALWLRDVKQPSTRPHTYASYRGRLEHIRKALGRAKLHALKPAQITTCYAEMHRAGFQPITIAGIHRVLNAALNDAVKANLLTRNPAASAVVPRVERKHMQTFTAEQLALILNESRGTRWHALWAVLAMTGMRIGEAIGLTWADIDHGVAQIQRSVSWDADGHITLAETKTARSRRSVHLPDVAVQALAAHRRLQVEMRRSADEWENPNLIFTNLRGGLLQESSAQGVWVPMLDRLELPRLRIHDLRHTAATLLLQKGVHPKVVQEMLGHSSITVTLDRYSHVLPAMHREAARTMDSLLGSLFLGSEPPRITPEEVLNGVRDQCQ